MGKARQVGKYQLGRTIGEGTFAEVKFAHNTENGESVAIKILAKSTILRHKMVDQIKRETSIMKIVRHPNIVELHEVLASRTKIYSVLDFIAGGSLFDKLVHQGRLSEDECRSFFQQLIDAIAHCHSKGVYHRDLKPENLLLDSHGRLEVSDFGLSSLHRQSDGLLHTTCGTLNYVAPEVLAQQGYNGALADVWSCGIVLFVLMAGYLPFDETDIPTHYEKEVAESVGPKVGTRNFKTRIEGSSTNKAVKFAVVFEVYEVAPSLFMIDVRKAFGETLEYHKFYQNFCSKLDNIIRKPTGGAQIQGCYKNNGLLIHR